MTVELLVSTELVEQVEAYLGLFNAGLVGQHPSPTRLDTVVFVLDAPYAPEGAVRMEPVFSCSNAGVVSVQSIEWLDANGRAIDSEEPPC